MTTFVKAKDLSKAVEHINQTADMLKFYKVLIVHIIRNKVVLADFTKWLDAREEEEAYPPMAWIVVYMHETDPIGGLE